MHTKNIPLLAALIGLSLPAMAGISVPLIGSAVPTNTSANAPAQPINRPLQASAAFSPQPTVTPPQPAVPPPTQTPKPVYIGGLEEARQLAELSRLNTVAEAKVKLLENRKKIADLERALASGGASVMTINNGSAPHLNDSPMSLPCVVSVVGFDDKRYAEISSSYGVKRFKVGDVVPNAGRIKFISIDRVSVCNQKRCSDLPFSSNRAGMLVQSPPAQEMPLQGMPMQGMPVVPRPQ